MEPPGRRYLCVGCRAAVLICSHCDRGNRYCTRGCAQRARGASLRAAGHRYQASYRGRQAHAERQRRYRERRKVTHHGSPLLVRPAEVAAEPTAPEAVSPPAWHCHVCLCPLPQFVRQDFLRRRIRRPPTRSDRSPHAHGAIP
jgi:hypothetical protein